MASKSTRRPQNSKPAKSGNSKYVEGMQMLRQSNAAGPHRSKSDYRRKPKHKGRQFADTF